MTEEENNAESDTGAGKNSPSPNSASPNQGQRYSRKVILEHFVRSADLITILLTDTILHSPTDLSQGAERFQALMRILLSSTPQDKKPVLIWVARDLSQFRHVFDTTKKDDRPLFDQLESKTIYAQAKPSALLYQNLGQMPKKKVTGGEYETLTLHSNGDTKLGADHYATYGHCRPEKKGLGWDNGPICEPLSSPSSILIQTADNLHLAHQLLIGNIKSVQTERAVKNLEGSGIYPHRLGDLI